MSFNTNRYAKPMLAFLQELVRIPSVNGRDGERAAAERIVAEAHRLGLQAELVAQDDARPNALVEWGTGQHGFAIIGHIDTVAEGDHAAWSFPPFGAAIDGDRLYGRGTSDNKAGIAIGLYTIALLRDSGLLHEKDVKLQLLGVADEESGATSKIGVRHLLDTDRIRADGAIYAYASEIVCVGHRGLLRLEIETHGRAIHSGIAAWSQKKEGVNAVTGLADILLRLEQATFQFDPHPAFDHLGCTITPGTIIRGGVFESMVADNAAAMVDIRLMPNQSADAVLAKINAIIAAVQQARPGLGVTVTVKNQLPAAAIAADHPLATIAHAHATRVTGEAWPIRGAGPANEGYMLIEAGIPTLPGFGPTGGNAHAPDEWVSIHSLEQTTEIFANIICDYLAQIQGEG